MTTIPQPIEQDIIRMAHVEFFHSLPDNEKYVEIIRLCLKEKCSYQSVSERTGLSIAAIKLIIANEKESINQAKCVVLIGQMEEKKEMKQRAEKFQLPTPDEIYDYWMEHGFCPRFQVSDHFGVSEQFVKNSIAAYSRSQNRTMPTGGRSLYI